MPFSGDLALKIHGKVRIRSAQYVSGPDWYADWPLMGDSPRPKLMVIVRMLRPEHAKDNIPSKKRQEHIPAAWWVCQIIVPLEVFRRDFSGFEITEEMILAAGPKPEGKGWVKNTKGEVFPG